VTDGRTQLPGGGAAPASPWLWRGPLLFTLGISLYFLTRYAGNWAEADSSTFANVLRAFLAGERLVPPLGPVYPNGFAFQTISATFVAVTGVDVLTLQQLIYPLGAVILVLPAWVAYRELTGSPRGAALATMLLFTQPELLFVILRSSHEKFTRTLLILCIFLLARSFRFRDRPGPLAIHVGLFYLVTFVLITSNNLLAHSFIAAAGMAMVLGRLLASRFPWASPPDWHIVRRLNSVTIVGLLLVYLVTFYIYAPASHEFLVMKTLWDRLGALFLDVQTQSDRSYTEAYGAVTLGWRSVRLYLLVSVANWILLGASLVVWAHQAARWLWLRETPDQRAWLVWLFYTVFALQGALSVVADASGALSSNLQHRLFPSFSMWSAALVGMALDRWRPRRFATPLRLGLVGGACCVAVLSVAKATNEPLASNKWTFYRPAELAAFAWTDAHLQDVEVWTDYDERLLVARDTVSGDSSTGNRFQGSGMRPWTRDVLVTDVTRVRSHRLGRPLPVPPDALRVYDNGEAEVYHLRPQTPYQR
jgi:hypothetical protein